MALIAKPANFLILAVLFIFLGHFAQADAHTNEVYFRSGLVSGVFQGKEVENGSFTSDVSLQIELLRFRSTREAFVLHTLLSNESGLGQARYFGVGGGQRFFLTDALASTTKGEGNFMAIQPSWAIYYGWDFNLSQFLVAPLSPLLATYSTMIDVGGTVGLRRVFSDRYSADAILSYSYGYSISSTVSVTASILRALIGVGYSF